MTELKRVIMERDDKTSEEADELINEAKEAIFNMELDPSEALEEFFGLEPDYIFDLI